MSNQTRYIICFVLLLVLYYHHNNKQKQTIPDIVKPVPVIVIPEPVPIPDNPQPKPIVPSDIIIDNYDLAISCGKKLDKPVLLIFTADWCGYCRSLKKELKSIIPNHKYVVCFLDIDNEINKKLVAQFNIKSLPTSIIIDQKQNKEIKRKNGFVKEAYQSWLN
jgi:thiol-disulfide isomerase/thioredoxin